MDWQSDSGQEVRAMRKARALWTLPLVCCLHSLLPSSAYATEFPYVAYVHQAGAYARSGPGQRHYPTGQLAPGYAVEVYRHDAGGWCAVRPPAGSFSWIPAHQVRMLDHQLAEITAEQAVARVGSALSPQRSAVQVLLPRGERVTVLTAAAGAPKSSEEPRWLQIAAPAGEFRWVAAADLSLHPPLETGPPPALASGAAAVSFSGAVLAQAQHEIHSGAFQHLQQARSIPTTPEGTTTGYAGDQTPLPEVTVIAGSPAASQLIETGAPANSSYTPHANQPELAAGSLVPRVRLPGSTRQHGPASEDVQTLELLLSQMVTQPPRWWDMAPLQAEVATLLQQPADTVGTTERIELRALQTKLERFAQVQQQYQQPTLEPTSAAPLALEATAAEPTAPAAEDRLSQAVARVRQRVQQDLRPAGTTDRRTMIAAANTSPHYDAVGRLKPVVSRRPQAPPYALVNKQGEVISFVTPQPDVDLQAYVGQYIGVAGTRGFLPEYRQAHVTAGRVSAVAGPK